MVSTSIACLWAVAGVLMGATWGVFTMGLMQAVRDEKKHKEADDHQKGQPTIQVKSEEEQP